MSPAIALLATAKTLQAMRAFKRSTVCVKSPIDRIPVAVPLLSFEGRETYGRQQNHVVVVAGDTVARVKGIYLLPVGLPVSNSFGINTRVSAINSHKTLKHLENLNKTNLQNVCTLPLPLTEVLLSV